MPLKAGGGRRRYPAGTDVGFEDLPKELRITTITFTSSSSLEKIHWPFSFRPAAPFVLQYRISLQKPAVSRKLFTVRWLTAFPEVRIDLACRKCFHSWKFDPELTLSL